jgi:hypothetical protein
VTERTEKTGPEQKVLLTRSRWACLMALRQSPHLMTRPFVGTELIVISRYGKPHPAPPPMLASLRRAGWLEQVSIESSLGEDSPFRLGKTPKAWRVTEVGRTAVAACPEFFPGEPAGTTDRGVNHDT